MEQMGQTPEQQDEEPLFCAHETYTWELAQTMDREVLGPARLRLAFIFAACLILAADWLLADQSSPAGYIVLALAFIAPLALHRLFQQALRRSYESCRTIKGRTTSFAFFESHFEARRENFCATYRYDELSRVVEGASHFYLMIAPGQGFAVPKGTKEQASFLRRFASESHQPERLTRATAAIFGAGLAFLTIWCIVGHEMPHRDIMRSWVSDIGMASLIFLAASGMLGIILLNRGRIAAIQKRGARIVCRIASALAAFILLAGLLLSLLAFDPGAITDNGNGTFTNAYAPFLQETTWTLYADDGPFYLSYLRPMEGPDDTDPSIDAGAFWPRHSGGATADAGDAASSREEEQGSTSGGEGMSSSSVQDDGLAQQEAGYTAISQAYSLSTEPTIAYGADGSSYAIVSDMDGAIRCLVYDRDSANERCGLYVLYEAKKAGDGSYSLTDATFLDSYAYEYGTGATAESGKESWSDVGSESYRDLTGE